MIKWKWVIGGVIIAALAVVIFAAWFNSQLWSTGQKMARGPNQIAFFEYDYEGDSGNNVFLLDADTQQVVQLTSGNHIYKMSWSPDGAVLYLGLTSGREDGYTVQVDPATGAITPLPNAASIRGFEFYDDVSPDGTQIVFPDGYLMHQSDSPIMVINLDGSGSHQIATGGPAQWSPDGTRIAFGANLDGTSVDIVTADSNGSDMRRVVEHEGADDLPAWSPDGKQIAFVTLEYGGLGSVEGGAPFIVDADGENLTELFSEYGGETYTLEFLPSGKVLLQTGPLYMCLIPIDGSSGDCEFVWNGALSHDGSQASALKIGGGILNPGAYSICLYDIEGATFGPERCDYESVYKLGYLLRRP